MILQALYELYERIPEIDQPGFAPLGLSWALVLDADGNLVGLEPLRIKASKGNRLIPAQISAPSPGKRTSGDKPGFLADKTDYLLGCDPLATDDKTKKKLTKRFSLFREAHLAAQSEINHPDFDSVCAFLKKWNPADPSSFSKIADAASGTDLSEIFGSNLAFRISGKTGFVHQLSEVLTYWSKQHASESNPTKGMCLVSGKQLPLARLHDPSIKGVAGAQSSGASMVSFNLPAFISFAKEQSLNAPVSENAAFAYCTTLNWLLSQRERRFRLGDATTVFWTEKPTPAETLLPWMMAGIPDTEDEATKQRVHGALEKISRGSLPADELGSSNTRFYILGLSPNASRLSVRFWHTGVLSELLDNLSRHFEHLSIVRQWDESNSKKPEPLAPSAYHLLRQTARDADGIAPLLSGALMRAILTRSRYPDALVQGVMNRIRVVEKNPRGEGSLNNVSYLRAAILKAWLVRNHKSWLEQQNIIMKTALDKDNPNVAYQLGRLFAVYEQVQRAAHEYKLERTIREAMFSAASATPLSIFGRLDRLNKHHLSKLKTGSNRFFSELLDEIHQKVRAPEFYPASLNLRDQSLFCIGYYHQRHDLRPPKEGTDSPKAETVAS